MNDQSEQTTEPRPAPRRFLRSRDDRWIGGVCGGLGRYFGVDPLLFRVGAVVLVLVGGFAALAYLVLWLVVPTDDGTGKPSGPAPLRRLLGGADGRISAPRVAAVIAAIVGGILATLALIVGAVWATGAGGGIWVAIVVIALGLAAVAGALTGRRRAAWLLAPALVIAAPAGFVAAADVSFDGGFGDRSYSPTAVAALPAQGYQLGGGRLRVDLRGVALRPGTTTALPIHVGMGVATIIVPSSVCVQSDAKVGAGYVNVLGDSQGGFDTREVVANAQTSAPRLLLRGNVGIGGLEVVHRPEDARFGDHGSGWQAPSDAGDNAACGGALAG